MYVLRPARTLCQLVSSKSQSSPVNGGILVSSIVGPASPKKPTLDGEFLLPSGSHSIAILVDSGAEESIMDQALALRLGLRPENLSLPISASALDGHVLGRVTLPTLCACSCRRATVRPLSSCSCLHQASLSSWGTPGFAGTTPTSIGLPVPSGSGERPASGPAS